MSIRCSHAISISFALIPTLLLAACQPRGCEPSKEEQEVESPLRTVAEREEGVQRVVLISIDTLRPDHLGAYGHSRDTSPNLDALAARGAVFADASTTAPWTLPAHASMLTGLYPEQTRVRTREVLGDAVPTIAEMLRAAGYRTTGVGNVSWLQPAFGLKRGFQTWRFLPADESAQGSAETITDFGIEFLEQNAAERCFLFLHYFDVHTPYLSEPDFERAFLPADFRESSRVTGTTMQLGLAAASNGYVVFSQEELEDVKKLYDAGILQLDSDLGRLFRFVEERFGYDDTLVIVTSDHGEAFFEHQKFSHGQNQYQEVLRVPLIVRGGSVPAGLRIDTPTSIVDIAPTILRAAGVDPSKALAGVDLSRYWEAPALPREEQERVLYSQSAPGPEKDVIRMARRGQFKLITNRENGQRELYDLASDPTEQRDLSKTRPNLVDELSTFMDRFFVDTGEEEPNTLELDPEVRERLKSLGYIE